MSALTELRERRAEVWQNIETLLDESSDAGMSHTQAERHAELEAEYRRLDDDVKARERADQVRADLEKPQPAPAGIGPRTADVVVNDKAYERAFWNYARTGGRNLNSNDRAALAERAQQVGTDSAGGYTVPPGFRQLLVERMVAFGGLAGAVQTIDTATGNNLEWPTLDDTSNSGEIVAESTQAAAGADLVFGTKTLGAYRYTTAGASNEPLRVSVELLQDSAFDLQALLVRAAGIRLGRKMAVDWVTGTGSGEPLGITTGVTGIESASAGAGITYPDLVTYLHSLDPAYRPSARWAFNDASLAYIRKLVDANDRPLWLPQALSGMMDMPGGVLLGYPVIIDQAFPDIDPADETVNWGVFGDLAESYVIRRVRDIQMIVDPYSRAKFGEVEYTWWLRADGTVQNSNSFICMAGSSQV